MLKKSCKALFIALLIGTCLGLTACGSVKPAGASSTVIYPDTTDAKPLTIGYTFFDMPLEGIVEDGANQIKLVADALNVNLIFNPDNSDLSAEGVVKAAKYFAEQGVDGMIVINFSDESLIDISEICEDSQIPFIQATRNINDPDIATIVKKNPYYVGCMHESEYAAAYEVGRKLVDKGAKKILLLSPDHGDVAYEARATGYRDACEEPDVDIIEESWGLVADESGTEAVKELLKKHPDADGIFAVRCDFVPFIVKAEDELGMSEYLPVAGVDFGRALGQYFDNGSVVAAAGGHHADASLSLITLVNSIRGAFDEAVYPVDINYSMMVIDSPKAFEEYTDWCLGYKEDFANKQVLNANDARGLCVDYNPNATLNDIIVFAESMSLEEVKSRHRYFVEGK